MSDAITEGKAAWDRLKSRERATWSDWMVVAEALILIRATAMKEAQTNKPLGSRYNKIVGAQLRSAGFDGISNQERYRVILCFEHREEIERWRAGLDDAARRRFNHPNSVWHSWRKSKAEPPAPTRHVVTSNGRHRGSGSVFWSQDTIRRAADAMRESRSGDRACYSGCVTDTQRQQNRRHNDIFAQKRRYGTSRLMMDVSTPARKGSCRCGPAPAPSR